jgi:hypothetical protein
MQLAVENRQRIADVVAHRIRMAAVLPVGCLALFVDSKADLSIRSLGLASASIGTNRKRDAARSDANADEQKSKQFADVFCLTLRLARLG